jgi:hypothetical protein
MIGHEHIEPAECLHRRDDQIAAIRGRAQILFDCGADARTAALCHQFFSLRACLPVVEGYLRSSLGKETHRLSTDAA